MVFEPYNKYNLAGGFTDKQLPMGTNCNCACCMYILMISSMMDTASLPSLVHTKQNAEHVLVELAGTESSSVCAEDQHMWTVSCRSGGFVRLLTWGTWDEAIGWPGMGMVRLIP